MPSFSSLTYSFSRREKALLTIFMIMLIGLTWYRFVYVVTTDQLTALEGRIQTVQDNIEQDNIKLAEKRRMQHTIEQRKAAGIQAKPIPQYDNLKPLMGELDVVMAGTEKYTLTFDQLDTQTTSYILRGVGMSFETTTYEEAKNIIVTTAGGNYPCIIDTFTINEHLTLYTTSSDVVTTNLHVVFIEKPAE